MVAAPPLPLVLASGSPRRRALLERIGVRFEVRPADVDESAVPGEPPTALALRLARDKATAVARALGANPARVVLGADTIVVLGARIFGKPDDADDAVRLLRQLLGHTHQVMTGVALVRSDTLETDERVVTSEVTLRAAARGEIEAYVASGEPLDKAGAYAVQGEGRRFVTKVEGSETNVIGLPLEATRALLRARRMLAEGLA